MVFGLHSQDISNPFSRHSNYIDAAIFSINVADNRDFKTELI